MATTKRTVEYSLTISTTKIPMDKAKEKHNVLKENELNAAENEANSQQTNARLPRVTRIAHAAAFCWSLSFFLSHTLSLSSPLYLSISLSLSLSLSLSPPHVKSHEFIRARRPVPSGRAPGTGRRARRRRRQLPGLRARMHGVCTRPRRVPWLPGAAAGVCARNPGANLKIRGLVSRTAKAREGLNFAGARAGARPRTAAAGRSGETRAALHPARIAAVPAGHLWRACVFLSFSFLLFSFLSFLIFYCIFTPSAGCCARTWRRLRVHPAATDAHAAALPPADHGRHAGGRSA